MIHICTVLRTQAMQIAQKHGLRTGEWKHSTHENHMRGLKNQTLWVMENSRITPSVERLVFMARKNNFKIYHVNHEGTLVEATEDFGAPRKRKTDRLVEQG